MLFFPIKYDPPVYRPPSEAESLLIPVTSGCSHNKCTFCGMYREKSYLVRPVPDILSDLEKALAFYQSRHIPVRKIFLCDGDALAAPMEVLVPVLERANELFPRLKRIGIYATARNILEKTDEELKALAQRKLNLAYLGIESGSDEVLRMVVKGNTAAEMKQASLKLMSSGWQLSVIIMLGLGGKKLTSIHSSETSKLISAIVPDFFSFLTTAPVPGTPYHAMIEKNRIEPLTTKGLLEEMRDILDNIVCEGKIIFRANHVSNQFPLGGILPRDRAKLVDTLDEWISDCPEGSYPAIDPCML